MNRKKLIEYYQWLDQFSNAGILQQKFKHLFPEAFLQVGSWYFDEKRKNVFCFQGKYSNENRPEGSKTFGFAPDGKWGTCFTVLRGEVYIQLPYVEVAQLILNEATTRGLIKDNNGYIFCHSTNVLSQATGPDLFVNGSWAKVEPKKIKNWYKAKNDRLCFFVTETTGYGIDANGNWINLKTVKYPLNEDISRWELASKEYVESRLFAIAKKEYPGKYIICKHDSRNIVEFNCLDKLNFDSDNCVRAENKHTVVCLLDTDGTWAKVNKAPMRWYKSKGNCLMFFISESDAFGFETDGNWIDAKGGYNLNRSDNWTEVDSSYVRGRLMGFAKAAYNYGTIVRSAMDNVTVGMVGKIDWNNNELRINSNGKDGDFSVILYNDTEGTWAKVGEIK